ncbi:MAG: small ribosomal subunit biogenesis GTPase RsgA [Gammaproteobacteria bacterium]|nr:small ribosomal subunit biogenesis GTPase RsgA [Gammaproteobacteria bacterium]MDJ0889576.1 small ribosomal subunit biogenesis GTPase RsgA [Gammaproteobacteria bacterium]
MPRPKNRRRFGFGASHRPSAPQTSLPSARYPGEREGSVIANHGKAVLVEDCDGHTHRCVIKHRSERAVSGDRVRWRMLAVGSGVVTRVLPRKSLLQRPDFRQGARPIAANLDQIVAVIAPRPEFKEVLLDRYLVTAEHAGIRPLIVLNKTDLLSAPALEHTRARLAQYSSLGYKVELSSVKQEQGLKALARRLKDRSSILVGQSGVGKSSLIRNMLPHANIAVGSVSKGTRLGRHTTSATTLYHLGCGGDIIDSPGVRDFGLWHMPPDEIANGFKEFREFLGHCRFRNCTHRNEPDCALRAAVDSGQVNSRRFESYHSIISGMSP